jgi:pyrroloquinoline quinone biosynthesis protein D
MTTAIDSTAAFRRCRDARYRNVAGEGLVVRQSVGEVLVLNDVGTRVLDLLEAGAAIGAVVDALSLEYEVDRAVLEQDVAAYLAELLDAGIVERVAA